jgi:hypothetical protein
MFNSRRSSILVFVLLLCGNALSKEKKGAILPDVVINAQTVAVVIMPNVAEPISNPNLSRNAQSYVENALVKWGRLRPVISTQDADLVIAIRKGTKGATPTVHGGGVDDRPVILQPGESDVRIAVQRGSPPSTSQTQAPSPERPQLGTSVGPSEDVLEVYQGHTKYPLDGVLVWRYLGKDGLNAPNVPAVKAFRKALDESIQQKQSPQSQKP